MTQKWMSMMLIFFVLMVSQIQITVSADTLTYQPITILTENCEVDTDQTVFFDVMILSDTLDIKADVNEMYLSEYPNGTAYEYHNIEGYTSYLAFYPEAEFVSVNCYINVYSIKETSIDSYRLVAFDETGELLHVSDVFNINDVGYDATMETVRYYQYDATHHVFEIIEEPVEVTLFAKTIDFLGSIILGLFVYAALCFFGIVPFIIYSKKAHKAEYVKVMLIGNVLLFLNVVLLVNFEFFSGIAFVVLLGIYGLVVRSLFVFLNKKYNPDYSLIDLYLILFGTVVTLGVGVLVLSGLQ